MKHSLQGRTALVTGGGSGIGRAAALAFARVGANVVVADVDRAGGMETVSLVTAAGGSGLFVAADVSRGGDVLHVIDMALGSYGQLDCAFNNAGIQGELSPTVDCSEENWDRITGINLKGVWLCMKHELAHMLGRGRGAIVNCASNFGLVGSVGMPAYSAAKHGVMGLTKTAALETAKSGVRVNAVCPGPVHTPLVDRIVATQPEIVSAIEAREPVGRMGRPEEIANAVVWLCSDEASFVTGAFLSVDGGYVAQ